MQHEKRVDDFIFGIRAIIEAIKAGKEVDRVLIKRGLKGEIIKELMDEIKANQLSYSYVPIEKLNRITRKNHQGAIALVSPISFTNIEMLIPQIFESGETPLLLVLDGVSDVRNFGAILRTAECAGVQGIIIPEKGSARIGPDAVKTSAGAIYNIPVCRVSNLKKTLQFLQESGITLFGASEKASEDYYKSDLSGPACIVMGAEDTGISDELLRIIDHLVKIPLQGKTGSLNVSVACAVLTYEAIRQRLNA